MQDFPPVGWKLGSVDQGLTDTCKFSAGWEGGKTSGIRNVFACDSGVVAEESRIYRQKSIVPILLVGTCRRWHACQVPAVNVAFRPVVTGARAPA